MRKQLLSTLLICTLLSGCSPSTLERLKRLGSAPPLDDVELPDSERNYKSLKVPFEMKKKCSVRSSNSLWQSENRTFFRDNKARDVGDIIKINVVIDDKAKLENQTSEQRNSSEKLPLPNLFRLEKKVFSDSGEDLLDIKGGNQHTGNGKIDRKETIKTEISAIVAQILPNGNMLIKGSQQIKVNFELRRMEITGIARPQDISIDNTIDSTKLAELRINYGGAGSLSDVQQPRIGNQIIDILSPF